MYSALKLLGTTVLEVAFFVFFGMTTSYAADLTVDGKLTVTNDAYFKYPIYAQGNEIKYGGALKSQSQPQIDFNIGDSKIYDDGNLAIRTDDYLTLVTDSQDFGQGIIADTNLRVNRDIYAYYPIYFYGNQAVVNDASTLRFRDPNENSLMTITDAGTTGNVGITGSLTSTTITDGTAVLTSGVLTGATGEISMWSGTIPDGRLSTNVTLQGNNFNGINQLVQLDGSGYLPAINASALTDLSKTQVGLGNVENIAISTWEGSSDLVTLGMVTTGTWHGTTISIANGGTGHTTKTASFDALSPLLATGDILYFNGTNNVRLSAGSDGNVLSLSGGVPSWESDVDALSVITNAITTNSISNSDYNQVWNWSLTTADKAAFTFGENIASTANGAPSILKASTLIDSTAMPLYVKNLGAGNSFRVDDESSDVTSFIINENGNVVIGSNFFDPTAPEKLKVDAGATTSYNVISGYGDVNNYLQLNIKNRNAGTKASSDIVATADNGTESNYFINMGIASSNYADPFYTFFWTKRWLPFGPGRGS
jgi:hypothetical protein